MKMPLHAVKYRLWQVRQQLGFVAPLTAKEREEVARWLPSSALPLFQTMSAADQRHSLRVCQGLQARGCVDEDMLAAALLHDVGKAAGRVPFWTRPVIVLGKMCAPRLLARMVVDPRAHRGQIDRAPGDGAFTGRFFRKRPDASRGGSGDVWGGGACTALGWSGELVGEQPACVTPSEGDASITQDPSVSVLQSTPACVTPSEGGASTPTPHPPQPPPLLTASSKPTGESGDGEPSNASNMRGAINLAPTSFVRSIVIRRRLALGYAWWHAEIGADLAAQVGLSERAVLYIRTHHQPRGPAAELHIVDEAS